MKRSIALAVLAGLIILGLAAYCYINIGSIPVLSPQGIVGREELSVIMLTLALCSIVVVPVFVLLFLFAWKYRSNGPKAHERHEPNWDHVSWRIELFWWLVPAVIIAILGVVAWKSSAALDPYARLTSTRKPLEVQVVALNWKWLFIYPDQYIATVNMLVIPDHTPVHFDITADAPMNSFWIPSLGGQIMAMPGMSNQLSLMSDATGTYTGMSANISGEGFAGMNFAVKSVSADDFSSWVQSVQAAQLSHPLSQSTYDELAKPSTYDAPAYYSLADPNLYTSIIMKYMMPAATTSNTMPGMQMTP